MFNKYFYNLSVIIIGIVTSIFILTTVGGLFHIPVNPFYVLIPFGGGLYYLKKKSHENIDFLKQLLILLLIIMVSYLISVNFWDTSTDGRWYHAATLVMLKNGWLPVYENYRDFAVNVHVNKACAFWGNCYLHFAEIIGANIYKITNLIESAKAVNFIMTACVFMYSLNITRKFETNNFNFLIPLIIVLNPVCICQWFTNYIDLHIYFAFTLLLFTIIKIELQQSTDKTDLFMFVCSSLMLAMTKFTGCMYLFVICLIYLIYLSLFKRNIKKFIKTVLIIGCLIGITGINPFFTNIRDFGHPFHPVYGTNKIDIISHNLPYGFSGKSIPEMFLRSTFSETLNSVNNLDYMKISSKLKIPFTIQKKSVYNNLACPEIRIAGFGHFWSGILLLSILYLPFLRFRNSNEKYLFLLIISMILLTTFSNPHCWWARLVPQLWLFPVFITFFGLLQIHNNKISGILRLSLLFSLIFSFLVNCSLFAYYNIKFSSFATKILKLPFEKIDMIKTADKKIYFIIRPEWKNMDIADETIIPHFEEYYGNKNIVYLPYDESRIQSGEFISAQIFYTLGTRLYFFKIDK